MSGADRYASFARHPVPGTFYEFVLTGQKLLDTELLFGATTDSLPILPRLPGDHRWLEADWRNRQSLHHREAWAQAIHLLLGALSPGTNEIPQSFSRFTDVACRLADQLLAEHQEGAMLVRQSLNRIPPHVRVLAAAKAIAPDQSSTRAAEHLNSGGRSAKLTRDHLDRAWRRFFREGSTFPQPGPMPILTTAVFEFDMLEFTFTEAQRRSSSNTKSLRGAALVEMLNREHPLAALICKAPVEMRNFRGKVPAAA